jgi:type IV pilus assembly protein PilB
MNSLRNPGFIDAVRAMGVLQDRDFERAVGSDQDADRLMRHMVASGLLNRRDCIRLWAAGFGTTGVDIRATLVDRDVMLRLPREFAQARQMMLLYQLGEQITAAVANPADHASIAEASRLAGAPLSVVNALPDELAEAIQLHYPAVEDLVGLESQVSKREAPKEDSRRSLEEDARSAEVVRLVETMLAIAVREGASDIHVEPRETHALVRFRIDGRMRDRVTFAPEIHPRAISRMKLLAAMDITERRRPQDGRITLSLPTGPVEFRASTVPTRFGEKIVLRSLAKAGANAIPELDELGLDADNLAALRRVVAADNGIVLVSGPTGSGKTTTLFAALKSLDGVGRNILTAEEPIEYVLPRASQVAVNRAIGLGFAELLRAFMRQDPDVMLVGEIRDHETAQVAAEAALTGHLVFATLHAGRALQAMIRMLQLGVPGYMLGPALLGVVAQRLAPRICPSCRVAYQPAREVLERHFHFEGDPRVEFYRGAGCDKCGGRGIRGRVGVHEIVVPNQEIRDLVTDGASFSAIADAARRAGCRTFRYDALKKVLRGLITIEQAESLPED